MWVHMPYRTELLTIRLGRIIGDELRSINQVVPTFVGLGWLDQPRLKTLGGWTHDGFQSINCGVYDGPHKSRKQTA